MTELDNKALNANETRNKIKKIFKVAQIRDLLSQVYNEKITFSRFVEILNEQADGQRRFNISPIDSQWSKDIDENYSLSEGSTVSAFKELKDKTNEIISSINSI